LEAIKSKENQSAFVKGDTAISELSTPTFYEIDKQCYRRVRACLVVNNENKKPESNFDPGYRVV
jgi:hypothetical protein